MHRLGERERGQNPGTGTGTGTGTGILVGDEYGNFWQKKGLSCEQLRRKKNLAATYSPTLLCAVPSAMRGLTSEFGMGSGISLSLMPPEKSWQMNHFNFVI
jgi:hypothetical protein